MEDENEISPSVLAYLNSVHGLFARIAAKISQDDIDFNNDGEASWNSSRLGTTIYNGFCELEIVQQLRREIYESCEASCRGLAQHKAMGVEWVAGATACADYIRGQIDGQENTPEYQKLLDALYASDGLTRTSWKRN